MIASGSLTDTLQTLQDSSRRPLVVTSADRADVLLGLAAVNMSGVGPHAAGVIATDGSKIGVRPALPGLYLMFAGLLSHRVVCSFQDAVLFTSVHGLLV